jgi:endo-1,4-beta-xylanase
MSSSVERIQDAPKESRQSRAQAMIDYMQNADNLDAKSKQASEQALEKSPPTATDEAASITESNDSSQDTDSSTEGDNSDLSKMVTNYLMQKLAGNTANSQNSNRPNNEASSENSTPSAKNSDSSGSNSNSSELSSGKGDRDKLAALLEKMFGKEMGQMLMKVLDAIKSQQPNQDDKNTGNSAPEEANQAGNGNSNNGQDEQDLKALLEMLFGKDMAKSLMPAMNGGDKQGSGGADDAGDSGGAGDSDGAQGVDNSAPAEANSTDGDQANNNQDKKALETVLEKVLGKDLGQMFMKMLDAMVDKKSGGTGAADDGSGGGSGGSPSSAQKSAPASQANNADSPNQSQSANDKLLDKLFGKDTMDFIRDLQKLASQGSENQGSNGGSGGGRDDCGGATPTSGDYGSGNNSRPEPGDNPSSEDQDNPRRGRNGRPIGQEEPDPNAPPPVPAGGNNNPPSGGKFGDDSSTNPVNSRPKPGNNPSSEDQDNPRRGRNGRPIGQEEPDPNAPLPVPAGGNGNNPSYGGKPGDDSGTNPISGPGGPRSFSPLGPNGPVSGDGLKASAAKAGMYAGAAVEMNQIDDPQFTQAVKSQFNNVTAENAMKWGELDKKGFDEADKFVNWAQKNDLKVRGHALVWHEQAPENIKNMNSAELQKAVTDHIDKTVKHFGNKVPTWDVVNETFSDSAQGGFRNSAKGDSKGSPFNEKIGGQKFLDAAFTAARKAGPQTELVLNDYNVETKNKKSDSMYEAVKSMKARGIPIDTVGFQAHVKAGDDLSSMAANIKRFKDLGVKVQITELDVAGGTKEQKAETARKVWEAAKEGGASGITTWGVTDKHSWIGNDPGLPFDKNMNIKKEMLAAAAA